MSLRGDPSFDAASLPEGARIWYERFLAALASPDQYPDAVQAASTGDLYQLGRYVNTHVTTVLMVFRFTGDLHLLDAIDPIMQAARAQLKDYNHDGYLNWRWLADPNNKQWYGDDQHLMGEILTHSLVAAVAWAYQENRNLESPAGIDYGERADFWKNYLKHDFEAKWRKRDGTSGYDYLTGYLMHAYLQEIRYFHYMGLLFGEPGYKVEATKLASALKIDFHAVTTPAGPGYVWMQGVETENTNVKFAQPTIYASNTIQAAEDLALEGMAPFAEGDFMERIANTVSSLVMDNGSKDFAADIAGGKQFPGFVSLPAPPSEDAQSRVTDRVFAIIPLATLAPYDATGRIARISKQVYDTIETGRVPRRIYLPAAFFIDAVAHP